MSEPPELLLWVLRAEEDYALVKSSLRHKKPLIYGATFHLQQCAEKYLKTLLVIRQQPFPKTHDLVALMDLCSRAGFILPVDENEMQKLAAYAVEVRYPGVQPTLPEVKAVLVIVKSLRRFARKLLGLK